MKLYGTIKSERASKGQGGNEYLEIDIQNVNQKVIAKIWVVPNGEEKASISISHNKNHVETEINDLV